MSTVQADRGEVIVWAMFLYTLGLLTPINHHYNAKAYLSVVAWSGSRSSFQWSSVAFQVHESEFDPLGQNGMGDP